MDRNTAINALQWHIDIGADEALSDHPVDATALPRPVRSETQDKPPQKKSAAEPAPILLGTSDTRKESIHLAKEASTLDALETAIKNFDGLSLKKTATNFVFSDGHPAVSIMLIGEVPEEDEDRLGKSFSGANGALLDLILSYIGLDRHADDARNAIYMTTILNWRPPGSRPPTSSEIDISLPFIEKHIAFIQPKLLIIAGGMSAKALLGQSTAVSKLRGKFYEYRPQTQELWDSAPKSIPALVTYNPAVLLNTPAQKKQIWHDMLKLAKKREDMGLIKT